MGKAAAGARAGEGGGGPRFPATRYQGSKGRLADWLWDQLSALDFTTCLDAFGGTGAVAHRLKREGKAVTYNDLLRANYLGGLALVENDGETLAPHEVEALLVADPAGPTFVRDTFTGIYFTDEENLWIDRMVASIETLSAPYRRAMGFWALAQTCLVKRPYNLFHRANLYLRLADVPRSFGNKAAWDRPPDQWFRAFAAEAGRAVFAGARPARALNCDALEVPGEYDLVYLDPPYVSARGAGTDYLAYYHFLEGLARYPEWPALIDLSTRNRRLRGARSPWADPRQVGAQLELALERFRHSQIALSYRSDGIPSPDEIEALLRRQRRRVEVRAYGRYQYRLSTNRASQELLFLAL